MFFQVLIWALVADALLSWFPTTPGSTVWKIRMGLRRLTEPFTAPCRALLAKIGADRGMLDFSPLLALVFIELIRAVVVRIILVV